MKKLLTFIAVIILVLIFFNVGVVSAHHNTIVQNASCSGYTVSAEYVGGSSYRRVLTDVDFTLDSNPTEFINQDWRGQSSGFSIFTRTGTGNHEVKATGTVKMYSCDDTNTSDNSSNGGDNLWTDGPTYKCDSDDDEHNSDNGWDLIETDTFTIDYKGQCTTPTPTPTATPSATPTPTPTEEVTPTPTPTGEPECEQECITPTPTPEVTPTPTDSPTPTPTEPPKEPPKTPPGGEPFCVDYVKAAVVGTGYRVDADTVVLQWHASTDPHDKQVLWYGFEEGNYPYNLVLGANIGIAELNALFWSGHTWGRVDTYKGTCVTKSIDFDP